MRTARAATGPGAGIAGLRRRLQFRARVVWRRRLAVAQFAFAFYGFATYNVLINPSDRVAQTVLDAMVTSGDYFFFALDGDRHATAFRSSIGRDNLAGLKANMHRIRGSATTDAQYRQAVAQFRKRPEPLGTLLSWVCRGQPKYLDLEQDRLLLRPA